MAGGSEVRLRGARLTMMLAQRDLQIHAAAATTTTTAARPITERMTVREPVPSTVRIVGVTVILVVLGPSVLRIALVTVTIGVVDRTSGLSVVFTVIGLTVVVVVVVATVWVGSPVEYAPVVRGVERHHAWTH